MKLNVVHYFQNTFSTLCLVATLWGLVTFSVHASTQALTTPRTLSVWSTNKHGFFNTQFEKFTALSQINIVHTRVEMDNYQAQLIQTADLNQAPDIAIVPADFLALANQLNSSSFSHADLTAFNLSDEAINMIQLDQAYNGIPLYVGNHLLLYYNKMLSDQPVDEFMQLLSVDHSSSRTLTLGMDYHQPYWFLPFLNAYNAWPYNNQGELTVKPEGITNALVFYKSLSLSSLTHQQCTYDCAYQNFLDGKVKYAMNGDWAYAAFQQKLGIHLGIAPLPKIAPNKKLVSPKTAHVMIFPAQSYTGQATIAIQAFIDFMLSDEIQTQMMSTLAFKSVKKDLYDQTKTHLPQSAMLVIEQMNNAKKLPLNRDMIKVWSYLENAIKDMTEAKKTVKDVMDKLELQFKIEHNYSISQLPLHEK